MDPRHERLADLLIHHSTGLQAGEHILIEAFDIPESMVIAAVKAAKSVGAHPHVTLRNNRLQRALIEDATDINEKRLKKTRCFFALSAKSEPCFSFRKHFQSGLFQPLHFSLRHSSG